MTQDIIRMALDWADKIRARGQVCKNPTTNP
jgi:hypothetical protein